MSFRVTIISTVIFTALLCLLLFMFFKANVQASEPVPNVTVETITKEELQEVTTEIYAQYMQDRQQELLAHQAKQVKSGTTFAAAAILLLIVLRFYQSR